MPFAPNFVVVDCRIPTICLLLPPRYEPTSWRRSKFQAEIQGFIVIRNFVRSGLMQIFFKALDPRALLPKYQTPGASGFDFHSIEKVVLRPGEIAMVRTGLAVGVPEGFELQIRARSGLSARSGVFLVNGIGTVDSDYRGEIKVIMSTCGPKPVTLEGGERIAQGVITRVVQAELQLTEDLSESLRDEGGFGSTGRGADAIQIW